MAKGACAIILDDDKAFVSFAVLKKERIAFLEELELPLPYKGDSVLAYLQENLDVLDQKIRAAEKNNSIKVKKIFLALPWGAGNKRVVSDTALLKRRKKVTPSDISFAREYLEDKNLDWDDFCINNIVIKYRIEGKDYYAPPLGAWAKKIEMWSLIVWVKDKFHREIESVFDNIDRNFSGFIDSGVGVLSESFTNREKNTKVAVAVNYGNSYFVVKGEDRFVSSDEFNFSLKKIIEELAKKFNLTFTLAEEVFFRYFSFKEISYSKEVTIRKDQGYMNLDIQTLNSFVKKYIKKEISVILQDAKEKIGDDNFVISFIGRLNIKGGFYGFLKGWISNPIKAPIKRSGVSFSFGCLSYGVTRFLERDYKADGRGVFLRRILDMYKEYF